MPRTAHVPIPADPAETIMEELTSFLRFVERGRILPVLGMLEERLEEVVSREKVFSAAAEELLSGITGGSYPALREIHDRLNLLEMERFMASRSVVALHANCTHYRDRLAERALELAAGELSARGTHPPSRFSLLSMGSDGRREQTLITDQDYLLVYADTPGPEGDEYFRELSLILVDRLEEIGFKKCTGDIMPSNPTWRGSLSQWRRRLQAIVRYEYDDYAKNLMDLIVISDARHVAGDTELATELIDTIRSLESDYFQVLWGMAKAATEMKLALGFLKRLWTEGSGEHKGEFNLKLIAWAPLVMNVRILAINKALPETSTLDRIAALEREGSLSHGVAEGLKEAYLTLTSHRIMLQIRQIKGIQKESYYLNPYRLSAEEREELRQSLLRIEELQRMIHINFSVM
ncbi:MAG TPA: putative nucleotidyltransferase substrate binding domain-containing protein [Verrucomicrobiae bacterium]|nr:putative nucleotidyltransferase substrate binding domain-containing protein [Verrucomicrobiae bacterium]